MSAQGGGEHLSTPSGPGPALVDHPSECPSPTHTKEHLNACSSPHNIHSVDEKGCDACVNTLD